MLTDDEVVRLVDIGVERLGVREVRFTGGEPLRPPRPGRHRAAHRRSSTRGSRRRLTTNALGLARTAQALADAGLDRVNVSLDTVRADTFHDDHPPRPARTT